LYIRGHVLFLQSLIMSTKKTVLALVSHPDDAEFLCAGTLALLHQKGWQIHIATMTPGDCGSKDLSREEISRIRRKEATQATSLLEGEYHCLECDDIFVMYDRPTLLKAITLIRQVRPIMVLTMSPDCYMVDHETTSKIAQTACFSAGMVNIPTKGPAPIDYTPHLYYLDPIEGKDKFGKKVQEGLVVDISHFIEMKEQMLACHESQRNWLREHHGMDEYLLAMKRYSRERGKDIGVAYGEGFRQHLGHAFPQDDLLKKEVGSEKS